MINYNVFRVDLLANVSFEPAEMIGDAFSKYNSYSCQIVVDSKLQKEVFSKNSGQPSDYFYYRGQKYSMGTNTLRCYGNEPYIINVQGGGFEDLEARVVGMADNFFDDFGKVSDVKKKFRFFDNTGYPDHIGDMIEKGFERLQSRVLSLLGSWASDSIGHMLDVKYEFDVGKVLQYISWYTFSQNDVLNTSIFLDCIGWKNARNKLFDGFSAENINHDERTSCARALTSAFAEHKMCRGGRKLKSRWYGGLVLSDRGLKPFGCDFLKSLKFALKICGLKNAYRVLSNLDEKYMPGSITELDDGMKLWVYNEHYYLQIPESVFQNVLIFINKYAGDELQSAVSRMAA